MCQFKSGIICKSNITIAEGENDSHSNLLESLGIKDNYLNASKTFVRAELVPFDDEWWTNPISWVFNVDQDIVPDWFEMDKGKYEKLFRDVVLVWWEKHVLVNKKIDKLSDGYYRLKGCEVDRLCNNVIVLLDNSIVNEMRGRATITIMSDNSIVNDIWENSIIRRMGRNSIVRIMHDSSVIEEMFYNSLVEKMMYNSIIQHMNHDSIVGEMYHSSMVKDMNDDSIVRKICGNSIVIDFKNYPTIKLIVSGENNRFGLSTN